MNVKSIWDKILLNLLELFIQYNIKNNIENKGFII